jgi:4-oxalocrotonate tautomerase
MVTITRKQGPRDVLVWGRCSTPPGGLTWDGPFPLPAAAITRDVMDALGVGDELVSVSMEEVDARDWAEKVYTPDIVNKPTQLYKKPGYDRSELP